MLTPEQQESKDAVLAGNRRAMARLITQLESTLPEEHRKGRELLETVLPHTANSTRIAVSGVPGVIKSPFLQSIQAVLFPAEAFSEIKHGCMNCHAILRHISAQVQLPVS